MRFQLPQEEHQACQSSRTGRRCIRNLTAMAVVHSPRFDSLVRRPQWCRSFRLDRSLELERGTPPECEVPEANRLRLLLAAATSRCADGTTVQALVTPASQPQRTEALCIEQF